MNPSNEFDSLFQEMRNVKRSEAARKVTLNKLKTRTRKKRINFIPVFVSGITVVTLALFFLLIGANTGMFENISSGSSGSNTLLFTGSSENWSVEYKAIFDGNTEKNVFEINYIGNGEPPQTIDYEVGNSNGTNFDLNQGTLTGERETEGAAPTQEDEKIKAIIQWNGLEETIDLKKH